jgi:hypothetical protein
MHELALQLHMTVGEIKDKMSMAELSQWGDFFKRKAEGDRRHGSHRFEDELDPQDIERMSDEAVARMFGAEVVRH